MNKETLLLVIVVVVVVAGILTGLLLYAPTRAVLMPPPPPPPGPSVEEIYTELSAIVAPLGEAYNNGTGLPDEARDQILAALQPAVDKYDKTDNGRKALARVADDVREICRKARIDERWPLMQKGTEIFGAFRRNPFFMSFYTELAETNLARPKVFLKGFFEDREKNDTYAFLEIHIHGQDKVETVKVRPGEEFLDPPHTLKFIKIIGRNRGVQLEFLAIPGDFFDAMLTELPGKKEATAGNS